MNTLETQNYLTFNNFGPVQQPVAVNPGILSVTAVPQPVQPMQQPTWQVTQVNPTIQVVPAPVFTIPIQSLNIYESIPRTTEEFFVHTPDGLQKAQASEYCVSQGNSFYAPEGWTLMSREEFFNLNLNVLPFPTQVTPLASPSASPSDSSRSASREVTRVEQTPLAPQKMNVKRPHRAKQTKIAEIHAIVKEYCVKQGIFAKEDEVLRGEDVLRIHVKTWEGLDLIESVIQEVEDSLTIAKIALPFSMKNKFQKKGFICYLKVQNVLDVPVVQDIFSEYSDAFKKCDVALPTNKLLQKGNQVAKPFDTPLMMPPIMAKRSSAA